MTLGLRLRGLWPSISNGAGIGFLVCFLFDLTDFLSGFLALGLPLKLVLFLVFGLRPLNLPFKPSTVKKVSSC